MRNAYNYIFTNLFANENLFQFFFTFADMQSNNILIAESGSTKTDWCLLRNGKATNYKTQGINPFFLSQGEIIDIFEKELKINTDKILLDKIIFYGSGIANSEKKENLIKCLRYHFGIRNITVESDMLAAALATCQHNKGIAVILGTGSNSCYFDGKKMAEKQVSLGFVLGDEGGGNHLGKKLLQYYLYGILEKEMQDAFEETFKLTQSEILESIYRKPFPNRFLAQFAKFCFDHRGHYIIENIIEDCLNEFFINHLIKYKQVWKVPVHFCGSVSYEAQDVIAQLCGQYNIELGQIMKSPMKGLMQYFK
jgi:N-acetylglucosamine kinase-like BadF-type ATPase